MHIAFVQTALVAQKSAAVCKSNRAFPLPASSCQSVSRIAQYLNGANGVIFALVALVLLSLGYSSPALAQMAGDGQPWTNAALDGAGWQTTCNTFSAIECSNQDLAYACAQNLARNPKSNPPQCSASTTSCSFYSLAADYCQISDGESVEVYNNGDTVFL